jgi:predicted amidohydrolase
MTTLVAGAAQFDVRLGETERNTARAEAGIRRLAARGARLVVLPEMFSSGFDLERLEAHAEQSPAVTARLAALARELGIVISGTLPEKTPQGVANTARVLGPDGAMLGAYRKVHLFRPTGEHRRFIPGNTPVMVPTPLGNIGLVTCFDLRFPELSRALAEQGASILLVSAQWPTPRAAHWDLLCRARAVENQLFVVACNRSGKDGNTVFAGRSQIISPWGRVLARAGLRGALVRAELDMEEMEAFRRAIPCLDHRVFAIHARQDR